MTEPNPTNVSAADEPGEAGMDQTGGELRPIVPGLREAIAAAFSVPLGPAILLGLVLQQVQGRLAEANAGRDGSAKPADPLLEEGFAGLTEQRDEPERVVDGPEAWQGQIPHGAIAACAEDGRPAARSLPAHGPREHPTSNIQRPTFSECSKERPLDVRGCMLNVGCSPPVQGFNARNFSGNSAPEPLAECGGVEDQPQRLGTIESTASGALPPRTQPRPDSGVQGAELTENSLPGGPARAAATETMAQHTRRVREILDRHAGKLSETLDCLAAETRQRQQQTLAITESIVAGQATFAHRLQQLEAQLAAHRNTGTSG